MSVLRPDFTSLIPVMNNSVSLHIYINNPYLKNGIAHKLNLLHGHANNETGTSVLWGLEYSSTHNTIGRRICYNRVDGSYTYKNDNVNGNWSVGSSVNYHRDWGEHKALSTVMASSRISCLANLLVMIYSINYQKRFLMRRATQRSYGHPFLVMQC